MGSTGRIVVDDVRPSSRSGYAVKALEGRPVEVSATLFRDGTGVMFGRVVWRARGDDDWTVSPMAPLGGDRFSVAFTPTQVGLHEFRVEAWTSRYETWRRDVRAKFDAGEEVESELLEGAQLLDELAEGVEHDRDRERLQDAARTLRSDECALRVRLDAGLDDAVSELLRAVVDDHDRTEAPPVAFAVERERAAVGSWYEFFPRSEGGFGGGAERRLEAIAEMGFDVVYLPPVHPIGRTNRKGRGNTLVAGPDDPGSPWAIGAAEGGHTAVHPELGTIDQFDAFVERAGDLGLEVALDYALQCSPDHPWVRDHPEWFHHLPDGSIRYAENPPKKYQDIHPVNFWPAEEHRAALWDACRDILTFWIDHGVSIFRVDNPHTKPVAFWDWLIPEIRAEHPDVVLLAEAFTVPTMMYKLGEVGFSQGYTYFTWRDTAREMRDYVEELARAPQAEQFRPNFWPNTPDILAGVLRDGPREAFELRAVLAALLSPSWGVYSGFELCENRPQSPENEEYHDSEKYRIISRDWSTHGSLAPLLTKLNQVRHEHWCTRDLSSIVFHHTDHEAILAWSYRDGEDRLLVIAGFDVGATTEGTVHLDLGALGLDESRPFVVRDELTGESWEWHGSSNYVRFDAGERIAHVFSISAVA